MNGEAMLFLRDLELSVRKFHTCMSRHSYRINLAASVNNNVFSNFITKIEALMCERT